MFYSDKCKNITLDVIDSITKLGFQLTAYKVTVETKNALDFQLSSYLGFLIGKGGTNTDYYIISNDKGYDCLSKYWKERNIKLTRISVEEPSANKAPVKVNPSSESNKKKNKVKSTNIATLDEIKMFLSKADNPEFVLTIFNQYNKKCEICNALSKHFRNNKKTSVVYKKLKPLLKEKNKT
jgi:hypothetical protein